jgi:hypothetical protein
MLSRLIALALLSAFVGNSAAHAQVTVDVAKITCRQYLTGKITTPRIVASWFSGYFHGERGDTTFDYGALGAAVRELDAFCRKHREMAVLEAARSLFGKR